MVHVRQADERDLLILPIPLEDGGCVRAHGKDFRAATRELSVLIPQARQLRAAVGSHKAAQEGEHYRFAAKIG